jgi:predicted TIM-barrel fold metal-dependent hydrolase
MDSLRHLDYTGSYKEVVMKKISVEEHFLTKDFVLYLHSRKEEPTKKTIDDPLTMRCIDVGERLREMDKAGIDMQVLSLSSPGVETLEKENAITWAKKTNDELAQIVKEHPARFAGLAALPCQDPSVAAAELERTIKMLGFKGAMIKSNIRGEYMDDKKYWPIFEKAEKLDVPIYLHPRQPSADMEKAYLKYPGMMSAMIGFGADVHLHVLRLMCSGLFDEFPRLRLIIGHMGETFPYLLWRIDNHFSRFEQYKKLKKKPSEYFRDNFVITTSGVCWYPSLLCAYLTIGADSILWAVDYPHEENGPAVEFIDGAPIFDGDKEKICHLNSERVFKL